MKKKRYTLEHHTGFYLSKIANGELIFDAKDIKDAYIFENESEAHKLRFQYLYQGFANYAIVVEVP